MHISLHRISSTLSIKTARMQLCCSSWIAAGMQEEAPAHKNSLPCVVGLHPYNSKQIKCAGPLTSCFVTGRSQLLIGWPCMSHFTPSSSPVLNILALFCLPSVPLLCVGRVWCPVSLLSWPVNSWGEYQSSKIRFPILFGLWIRPLSSLFDIFDVIWLGSVTVLASYWHFVYIFLILILLNVETIKSDLTRGKTQRWNIKQYCQDTHTLVTPPSTFFV